MAQYFVVSQFCLVPPVDLGIALGSLVLGLCRSLLGGQRVSKCPRNSNGRTNDSITFHGLLEDNGRDDDDDDSFGSVEHRRRDGTNMARKGKGWRSRSVPVSIRFVIV